MSTRDLTSGAVLEGILLKAQQECAHCGQLWRDRKNFDRDPCTLMPVFVKGIWLRSVCDEYGCKAKEQAYQDGLKRKKDRAGQRAPRGDRKRRWA